MSNTEDNCFDRNDYHSRSARHPHIVTLTSGTTTISDQSTANTDIIFAGTSLNNEPTLQFIGSATYEGSDAVTNAYSTRSLTVAGDPWQEGTPAYGSVSLGFRATLEVTNGVHVTDGQLSINSNYVTNVTYGGNSIIDDGGTLNSGGPRYYSAGSTVDGTITLGTNGANQLSFAGDGLLGNGTIRQLGKNDLTRVDYVAPGVHLDIRSGTLMVAGATGRFDGTIGPANGSRGPSLGSSATVEFFGYGFSPTDTQTAKFDTSTGLLSLLDSSGGTVGDFHFSGNASGLNVSVVQSSGFNAGYVAITDHPGTASPIPITFTS